MFLGVAISINIALQDRVSLVCACFRPFRHQPYYTTITPPFPIMLPLCNDTNSKLLGFGGGRSNSSYYKRSPRSGFLKRMYTRLRRLLRDLIHYMKRNPIKVFMLVILPLITGGALTTLLSKFGIRLPAGVEKMFNTLGGKPEGGKGMEFERERIEAKGFDFGNAMGGIGGAVSLAKMFM